MVGPQILTLSRVTANNKVYDQTNNATLNFANAAIVGVVSGDVVALNASEATGAFSSKDVGNDIGVTVSGLTLTGPRTQDYKLISPTPTANITPATLTVTGITASNKPFDGTTVASLNSGTGTLTNGNFLVSDQVVSNQTTQGRIREFTPAGVLVQTYIVPASSPSSIIVDSSGNLDIYDQSPSLITLNTATGTIIANTTFTGWGDFNGGLALAAYGNHVFAVDGGANAPMNGIIDFDIHDFSAELMGDAATSKHGVYINVAVGQNGLLYALYPGGSPGGSNVDIYDPRTLSLVRSINLAIVGMRSIAVDSNGEIFAIAISDPNIYEFDANGATIKTVNSGNHGYANININKQGRLIASAGGTIVLTDTSLSSFTTITTDTNSGTFVAWVEAPLGALQGVISGDMVAVQTSTAVAAFASSGAGVGITVNVTGMTIGGPQAADYRLVQPTMTASIIPRVVTISAVANTKTYDATSNALAMPTFSGLVGSDTVTGLSEVYTRRECWCGEDSARRQLYDKRW